MFCLVQLDNFTFFFFQFSMLQMKEFTNVAREVARKRFIPIKITPAHAKTARDGEIFERMAEAA